MTRECGCEKFEAGGPYVRGRDCPVCWRRAHPYVASAARGPCRWRGEELTGPQRVSLHEAGQTWVDHVRVWALCGRPGFALEGQAVCPCGAGDRQACGPTCPGYEVRPAGEDDG